MNNQSPGQRKWARMRNMRLCMSHSWVSPPVLPLMIGLFLILPLVGVSSLITRVSYFCPGLNIESWAWKDDMILLSGIITLSESWRLYTPCPVKYPFRKYQVLPFSLGGERERVDIGCRGRANDKQRKEKRGKWGKPEDS